MWYMSALCVKPLNAACAKVNVCASIDCEWMLQVPSREVDKDSKKFWTHWNRETKQVRLVRKQNKCDLYEYIRTGGKTSTTRTSTLD